MTQTQESNGEIVLGYCPHCKFVVIEGKPDTKIIKRKPWHEFCWEQKHNRPKECKFE